MAGNKVMAGTGSTDKMSENAFHFNLSVEDDLIECIEYVPCPEFEFSAISCYICNGYYGPCFGEPVCATCHAFLFPNDIGLLQVLIFSKKTDDEDSGNDEPTELFYERRASHNQSSPQSVSNAQQRIYLDDENLPVARQNLPKQVPNIPNAEKLGKSLDIGGNEDEQRAHLYNWNSKLREEPEEHSSFPSLSERLSKLSNYIEQEPINEPGLIERLPPEVLLVVFSNLDDVSLWSAAKVCRRWFGLLSTHVTSQQWQEHVKLRWPLYKPVGSVRSWYRVYDALASSAPCYSCLLQTSLRSRVVRMEENSWRRIRLRNEVKSLRMDPPEGIAAIPLDPMCCHWQATITGPVGSPYEGGLFYLYLEVPFSYPMCPPVVRFLTKILHPNVSRHGDVGIDSIHHNWSLALTLSKVLISVQSLLTDPYCQVCMEPELGEMYTNDRERFDEIARSWTWRYAMHDILAPI